MTTLSEILSRSSASLDLDDSVDHRESASPMVGDAIGDSVDADVSPAPELEAAPFATFDGVPEFRSNDSPTAADDENFEGPQAQIDRLIAAHETWLADVQITLPSHVGAQVLNYAIQRSLRTRGLSIDSTPIVEDGPPKIPSAAEAPTIRENMPATIQHMSVAEPGISYGESEAEVEPDINPATDQSELLKGTVELGLISNSSVGGIAQFLVELRGNKNLRLLEMKRDGVGSTIVSLGLKRPLPLKRVLLQMGNVEQVDEVRTSDGESGEATSFRVSLTGC